MMRNKKIKRRELIQDHFDIKLFGILFAVKDKLTFKQIGPVQFSIGQSLNTDVEVIPISMTRIIPNTKNEQGESLGGTFGEKYVVRYSFIEFHGFVNNNVAKEEDVDLKEHDVITMLTAMWRGTDSLSTSSKFGQSVEFLINPRYRIYVDSTTIHSGLMHSLREKQTVFTPYLGTSSMISFLKYVDEYNLI
jgi:CRISPR-associated protein Csh2